MQTRNALTCDNHFPVAHSGFGKGEGLQSEVWGRSPLRKFLRTPLAATIISLIKCDIAGSTINCNIKLLYEWEPKVNCSMLRVTKKRNPLIPIRRVGLKPCLDNTQCLCLFLDRRQTLANCDVWCSETSKPPPMSDRM